MKKVGLLTWFNYDNYGTVLQSVALSSIVNTLGYDVEGINYVFNSHNRTTKLERVLKPRNIWNKSKRYFNNIRYARNSDNPGRNESFDTFKKKHLHLTKPMSTLSELNLLNKVFDAFICGSDQIWSPREYDPKFYLSFVENQDKMISYAPSLGCNQVSNQFTRKRMTESVKRFKSLSVREETAAELLKDLCSAEAEVVLDPTLLLSSDEWNNYIVPVDVDSNQPYIFCYFLGENSSHWRIVKQIAQKSGYQVIVVPVHPKDFHRGYYAPKGIGPGEFLSLIKNAAFVCTDSFHGTIFSILYQRPFATFKRFSDRSSDSQNSRIYNLLRKVGLDERLVNSSSLSLKNILRCNFTEALEKIKEEREKSIHFLSNALTNAIDSSRIKSYTITNTCCGCSVCMSVCKQNAISIKENDYGFYEAVINQERCNDCGLCRKVCAFNGLRGFEIDKNEASLYMLRSNSESVLTTSTSGGAAYEISKLLSLKGYDVVGCTYDKQTRSARHIKIVSGDIGSLSLLQGSKYLQSNTTQAFKDVLSLEHAVIIGTPCQIAGLHNLFAQKKCRENYVLVDLICHGVPTHFLWEKYLNEGSQKYGYGNTPEVFFRYKKYGWKKKYICLVGNGVKYIKQSTGDLFYRFFEHQNCFMPSCYECNYRTSSKADIRIGDYWGEKYNQYKNSGASMVISMTDEGRKILQELHTSGKVDLVEEEVNEYYSVQYPQNPIKPLYYDELIKDLNNSEVRLKNFIKNYFFIEVINKRLQSYYARLKRILP